MSDSATPSPQHPSAPPPTMKASSRTAYVVIGAIVGLALVIGVLGWTTFISTVLWIVIAGAVLVVIGFGLFALGSKTKKAKENFGKILVGCAIAIILACKVMPSNTATSKTSSGTAATAPTVVSDDALRDGIIGVWSTQTANDTWVLCTFRPDGTFLRRFQSQNPLKDVGAMVFGADQISGRWWVHNRRLCIEWERGGDFNPASGVLKGNTNGGYVKELTDQVLVVPGLETQAGVFQRVQ